VNREDFINPTTGEIDTAGLMAEVDRLTEENAALDFKVRQSARSEVALRKELSKMHADDPRSADIREVLEYWIATCHKSSRTKIPMDGVRAQKVRSRLNQKFTVEDLKLAIDGAAAKPFVGPKGRVATQEPGCRREDDLELILRDEKYVERFQGYAKEAQKPALTLVVPKPTAQPQPVRSDYDPLQAVHERAKEMGLEPNGEVWRFRASCPAHKDTERSLLVIEGADGRAVLDCGRRCEREAIAKALGLSWGALFPPGHRHHRLRRQAA
jgi:hypothetical protein